MKPALTALVNYLNSNDTVVLCDLYTFALAGGIVLRQCDYPLSTLTIPATNFPGSPLNYAASGNVIFSRGPRFGRTKVNTKVGIEPAELDLDVYAAGSTTAESADMVGTLTWQQFAQAGGFDGATVEVDRFFIPTGGDGFAGPLVSDLGCIVWFYGKVADIDISRSVIKMKIKSYINLLQQQQMPRRLFQSGCTHIFGDAMCKFDRVTGNNGNGTPTGVGAFNIEAVAGSSQTDIINAIGVPSYMALGTCTGLSGQNTGISRGIQSVGIPTIVGLLRGFPYPVMVGDLFQLLPGCTHQASFCQGTLNNLAFYGGFDYVPPPEYAL